MQGRKAAPVTPAWLAAQIQARRFSPILGCLALSCSSVRDQARISKFCLGQVSSLLWQDKPVESGSSWA